MNNWKKVVEKLTEKGKTISTMESCTGGEVASEITSVEGASEVLKFSAVTYSNEYKIKMGVSSEVIEKYSVYSMETAREMAYHISEFAISSYGVGITGKLNRVDSRNLHGKDNMVYVCIYDRDNDNYYELEIEAQRDVDRLGNKQYVAGMICDKLLEIL